MTSDCVKTWAELVSPLVWRSCVCHPAEKQITTRDYFYRLVTDYNYSLQTLTDRVQLANHHVGRHLSGVSGVSDVIEALRCVSACLLS